MTLESQNSTFRVLITLKTNYQLDLTASNFKDLIGFDRVILKDEKNYGTRVPNLSKHTEMLNIDCHLVITSLVDGVDTDIIFSFSTSVLRPSYCFTIEPRRVTFNFVNKNTIPSLRIYITDRKRGRINLNNAETAFSLLLKRIVSCYYMKSYEFTTSTKKWINR